MLTSSVSKLLGVDLFLPDMHFPHQDERALACVLAATRSIRPRRVFLAGDNLEGAAFSSHPLRTFADRAPSFLGAEVGPLNDFLDKLQGRNSRPLVYCEGNHEQRIERKALSLGSVGRELYQLASPEHLIRNRVDAHGNPRRPREEFHWQSYYGRGVHSHVVIIGQKKYKPALIGIHGWSHAANASAKVLAVASDASVLFGHTHRAQYDSRRIVLGPRSGQLLFAQSFGCLRDFAPTYTQQSPNNWTHGFGVIHEYENSYEVFHVSIDPDGSAALPSGRRVVG